MRRGLQALGSAVRAVLLVVAAVAIGAAGMAQIPGVIGDRVADVFSAVNPFHRDAVDRTGPAVLYRLTELKEFTAARGYYEVIVDLDPGGDLPSFLTGDRVIYVGKGEVKAVVDFSELDERRVVPSEDGKSVTVTLPSPRLDEPRLDLRTSDVVFRDEGFITKFKGSDLERKAQLKAEHKLSIAANGEGRLLELAEESTSAMLEGLFRSLGYTNVAVSFDQLPASRT